MPTVQTLADLSRAAAEAARPFDLARSPLLRACLLRCSAEADDGQDHLLVLTLHHIAADGWSLGILVREVGALYTAFVQGLSSPLPPLPLQYADFALWQREWLQGEVLERQIDFWRGELAGARLLSLRAADVLDRGEPASAASASGSEEAAAPCATGRRGSITATSSPSVVKTFTMSIRRSRARTSIVRRSRPWPAASNRPRASISRARAVCRRT